MFLEQICLAVKMFFFWLTFILYHIMRDCFLRERVSFKCSDKAVKLLLHLSWQRMKITPLLRLNLD